jgi:hypothetical protein
VREMERDRDRDRDTDTDTDTDGERYMYKSKGLLQGVCSRLHCRPPGLHLPVPRLPTALRVLLINNLISPSAGAVSSTSSIVDAVKERDCFYRGEHSILHRSVKRRDRDRDNEFKRKGQRQRHRDKQQRDRDRKTENKESESVTTDTTETEKEDRE